MSLKQIFCRHSTVKVVRAHAESRYGKSHPDQLAWVDRHDVHNFFVCSDCGKALKSGQQEPIFDSKEKA